uniref:TOM1-like protein 2 n=1 Tax=Schistocephalus solidus TaxID=70667 RepID=A0A0X3PE66_SCHSO
MWTALKNFFYNPLSYSFGRDPLVQEITAATNSSSDQPDQTAFLDICEHINQKPDGPSIALSAVVDQLEKSAAKDSKTANFTLTLLDLCVKNCGYRFITELCNGGYLKKLELLTDHGKCADTIRTRILTLIKVWALAFSDHFEVHPINDLYNNLVNNGVEIPDIDRNEVDLLKRTITPNRMPEVQSPAATNARKTQLMQAIRHDLDLTTLDLPAFEALLQGLSCNPPDTVTMKQLQASADRLDGLQRRLEAYIRQLSENMDTEPESIQEEQPMLDELIRVNDKILDGIQQFQSFEKMRCREEDEEKEKVTERMLNASTSGAAGTTLVTVAKQQEVQEALSEASSLATAPATAVTNVAEPPLARTNDVLQTLREAREALQLFYLLQQDIRASSAQVADRTLLGELRVVAERLEDLKKNVQTLINAKMRETSADLTGEAEANLASLTSVNEELLRCVENYRRYGTRQTTARNLGAQTTETAGTTVVTVASQPEAPNSSSAASSVATAAPVASTGDAVGTRLAATTDVSRTLREAREGIQLFQTLQREMSASSDEKKSQETPGQTLGATGAEATLTTGSNAPEAPNYLPTGAVAENPILAMDAVEPAEADRNEGSRMISERTLVLQAREAIEQFNALHGDARMSTAQMTEMKQMRELGTIGGRLVGLQQKVQGLINEKLCGNSGGTSEEHETALENLMGLNDELHHCVENYQRALREAESEEMSQWTLGSEAHKEAAPLVSASGASVSASTASCPAMDTADAKDLSRMIIQGTLSQAKEAIQLFKALQGDMRTSSAQMTEVTQMNELRTVGEHLQGLQKELHGLINEKLIENVDGFTEEADVDLANLMGVNDEVQLCVENYQRAVREFERRKEVSVHAGAPELETDHDSVSGTGAAPAKSLDASNQLQDVTGSAQSAKSAMDAQATDQDIEITEERGLAPNAAAGKPKGHPMDDLKMVISHTLADIKANVKSLSDLLQHVNLPGTPVTDVQQIKTLSNALQEDLQQLRGLQMDYEAMEMQQSPSSRPTDVDPLLMDLYMVPSDVERVLEDSKTFLDGMGKFSADDVPSSAKIA